MQQIRQKNLLLDLHHFFSSENDDEFFSRERMWKLTGHRNALIHFSHKIFSRDARCCSFQKYQKYPLGHSSEGLGMENASILYGHLVYFMTIRYILAYIFSVL
jgi:hypothetical protein